MLNLKVKSSLTFSQDTLHKILGKALLNPVAYWINGR